jgi:hypothetical protein
VINWRLVVNLVFLLLLLFTARRQWFQRASDDDLRRRAGVKRFYGLVFAVAGVRFLWSSGNDAYGQYMTACGALCLLAFLASGSPQRYRGEMFDNMKRAVERRRQRLD